MRIGHICILLLATASLAGCLRTRHVEFNSVSSATYGPCPTCEHHETCDDRRWCGFRLFCPERKPARPACDE